MTHAGRKPRILIVDDSPTYRLWLEVMLQHRYEVFTAEDGEAGGPEGSWFRREEDGGWARFEGHEMLVALNHDEPALADHVVAVRLRLCAPEIQGAECLVSSGAGFDHAAATGHADSALLRPRRHRGLGRDPRLRQL